LVLSITPIPAFDDNYIWLLNRSGSPDAVVVDPGDEAPVMDHLSSRGLKLAAILVTHHHWDHTGGIEALAAAYPEVAVYGPRDRRIADITHPVGEKDRVSLLDGSMQLSVLEVPGHTASHIAYHGDGVLFCGDTLFAAGCGRVFDGTFGQLAASLARLATLPKDTRIYCAHEYTLANLGFARWVEPENPALRERLLESQRLRAAGQPTVPSLLSSELATNPFLRTTEPTVIAAAEARAGRRLASSSEVFTALRRWKDADYD
jgi:hydroxyacylglutathione hydrolase